MKKEIFNLGKDSMIYGVGSVVTRFIGLFTLPIFTSYLSPEEYGVLAMLALLTMVAHPVFSLGLSAAMGPSYFEGNNPQAKSTAVWTVFIINAYSSSILLVTAWLFPEFLGKMIRLPSEYALLVSLSLTGCAFSILTTSFIQRVQFEKQARLYVMVTLATAITAIIVSLITVVFLGWGAKGMVAGQLSGNAINFFAFLMMGLKATKLSFRASMAKELLRMGLPLVPGFAFLFILMHANKYILEWQVGLGAVGVYSIGFNLGMVIRIVTGGIATAWYPFFMSYVDRQADVKVIFGRIFTYYVFGVGFLCFMFFVAAKPAVHLLTQESYHGAYMIVGLVALANFIQTLFNLFLPGLYFKKEIQYISLIQGFAALFSLPINYYLIVYLGVLGAGAGVVIGNLLMVVFMYGWNNYNKLRYPVIAYEWRRVFSFVLFSLVLVVSYLLLPKITVSGEIIKSFFVGLLMLIGIFAMLNEKERTLFISKLSYR